MNAVRYVLHRQAIRLTPGWRSTTNIHVWNIWASQPCLGIVSTWGIASRYIIPGFSPPNPDTWFASSRRRLRLSSIPIIWTVRMTSVQVSHGHLPSASQKILWSLPPRFLELLSLQGLILVGVNMLLLSGHQLCPLWPIISHKPPQCCPCFPPLLSLLTLHHLLRTYTQNFSPTLHGSLPTTPLLLLPWTSTYSALFKSCWLSWSHLLLARLIVW
jgi:hypothetical protein